MERKLRVLILDDWREIDNTRKKVTYLGHDVVGEITVGEQTPMVKEAVKAFEEKKPDIIILGSKQMVETDKENNFVYAQLHEMIKKSRCGAILYSCEGPTKSYDSAALTDEIYSKNIKFDKLMSDKRLKPVYLYRIIVNEENWKTTIKKALQRGQTRQKTTFRERMSSFYRKLRGRAE